MKFFNWKFLDIFRGKIEGNDTSVLAYFYFSLPYVFHIIEKKIYNCWPIDRTEEQQSSYAAKSNMSYM